jgi:hypothetical protein
MLDAQRACRIVGVRHVGHCRAGKRSIVLRLPPMRWPRVLGSLVGRPLLRLLLCNALLRADKS